MLNAEEVLNSDQVLKIICEIIPENVQKQHTQEISGKVLTLEDQFSKHWDNNGFIHSKYKEAKDLERTILYCWWKYWKDHNICAFDVLFI